MKNAWDQEPIAKKNWRTNWQPQNIIAMQPCRLQSSRATDTKYKYIYKFISRE